MVSPPPPPPPARDPLHLPRNISIPLTILSSALLITGNPVPAILGLSLLAFLVTHHLIPLLSPTFLRAGFRGRDLCKVEKPEIPECLGALSAVVYIITVICFIPFPFLGDLVTDAPDTTDPDVFVNFGRTLSSFPYSRLASYLSAIISLQCIALLGIADDLFDLRWRHKWWIPGLASIPLLVVYFTTYNVTSITTPTLLRPLLGSLLHLGPLYYVYMSMLAMFCPQSINMLAGINGIEVSQCVVIALLITLNDALYLLSPSPPPPALNTHLFSLYLLLPWLGTSLALLRFNWAPARVFVGDTYCYFSGMLFATVSILGHFTKTLFLLLTPQLFNFLFSTPQIFGLIPCPRHRMPSLHVESGLLRPSMAVWEKKKPIKLIEIMLIILEAVHCVKIERDEKGQIVANSNLTLLNLWLVLRGPMSESQLAAEVTGLQFALGLVGLFIRHQLALLVFTEDNRSMTLP